MIKHLKFEFFLMKKWYENESEVVRKKLRRKLLRIDLII
jgi:hypothetical protein